MVALAYVRPDSRTWVYSVVFAGTGRGKRSRGEESLAAHAYDPQRNPSISAVRLNCKVPIDCSAQWTCHGWRCRSARWRRTARCRCRCARTRRGAAARPRARSRTRRRRRPPRRATLAYTYSLPRGNIPLGTHRMMNFEHTDSAFGAIWNAPI